MNIIMLCNQQLKVQYLLATNYVRHSFVGKAPPSLPTALDSVGTFVSTNKERNYIVERCHELMKDTLDTPSSFIKFHKTRRH